MDGQALAKTQGDMIHQSFVKNGGLASFILKPVHAGIFTLSDSALICFYPIQPRLDHLFMWAGQIRACSYKL